MARRLRALPAIVLAAAVFAPSRPSIHAQTAAISQEELQVRRRPQSTRRSRPDQHPRRPSGLCATTLAEVGRRHRVSHASGQQAHAVSGRLLPAVSSSRRPPDDIRVRRPAPVLLLVRHGRARHRKRVDARARHDARLRCHDSSPWRRAIPIRCSRLAPPAWASSISPWPERPIWRRSAAARRRCSTATGRISMPSRRFCLAARLPRPARQPGPR